MDTLAAAPSFLSSAWAALPASPTLWFMVAAGVFLGMTVGVLPGFGPPAAMALLFPLAYTLDPLPGISLLAGIFYGAKYGGAVTSILMGIPGEADAVATLFEGRPLALAGKAKQALTLATLASFAGGTLACLGMALLAPVLARAALFFGPSERAAVMIGALALVAFTSPGGARRGLCMVFLGLFLALPGLDPVYGTSRLTFGSWRLSEGVELTSLLLGLFGLGDLLDALLLPERDKMEKNASEVPQLRCLSSSMAALRGCLIGFLTGLVPCGAGVTASFASHALEKRLSRRPEDFGKGAWEGLVGPEASNNAAAMASFAPLLLLGLPTNPIMAAMLGALTVMGVVPGPSLPEEQPAFYWGFILCLLIGNVLLLALGLGLADFWARLSRLPFRLLWPVILLLCLTGSYVGADSISGPIQCLAFGLLAVFLKRLGCSPAPLVLAFVLGPRLETHLVQTLLSYW